MRTVRDEAQDKFKIEEKAQSEEIARRKTQEAEQNTHNTPRKSRREKRQLEAYIRYTTRLCQRLLGLTPEFVVIDDKVKGSNWFLNPPMAFSGYACEYDGIRFPMQYPNKLGLTDKSRANKLAYRPLFVLKDTDGVELGWFFVNTGGNLVAYIRYSNCNHFYWSQTILNKTNLGKVISQYGVGLRAHDAHTSGSCRY